MAEQQTNVFSSAASAPSQAATSVAPKTVTNNKGTVGLATRTNYSRVNTAAPPASDAGASSQKSISPRLDLLEPKQASAGEMKMSTRVPVSEMVKAAYAGVAARSKVASIKSASAGVDTSAAQTSDEGSETSTTHVLKVAHSLEQLLKTAEDPKVTETQHFTPGNPVKPNQTGHAVVHAPADKQKPDGSMVTTETNWHGKGPQKVASLLKTKQASAVMPAAGSSGTRILEATDAGPSVDGKDDLLSSNEKAQNFTKRDAQNHEKPKVKAYLREPMASASTDPVLKQTLTHDGGSKIASVAARVKSAAAQSLITKIASDIDDADKKKKKAEEHASC